MMPGGLTTCLSGYGPTETMDRLATAVTAHGMSVLARIDHAAAAVKIGMKLRPTEVLIFGNPRAGTPLMQAAQTMGIDLPLKALSGRTRRARPGSPITIRTGSPSGMMPLSEPAKFWPS
jgi:uncharacterized protein (DUF302 family)